MAEHKLFVPWYVKHPAAFFERRPEGQSFLGRVWVLTGWRWANRLMPEQRRG